MDRSTAVFDQPLHIGLHWLTPSMAHVVVKGEIDMTNAHLLREQLCRAIMAVQKCQVRQREWWSRGDLNP